MEAFLSRLKVSPLPKKSRNLEAGTGRPIPILPEFWLVEGVPRFSLILFVEKNHRYIHNLLVFLSAFYFYVSFLYLKEKSMVFIVTSQWHKKTTWSGVFAFRRGHPRPTIQDPPATRQVLETYAFRVYHHPPPTTGHCLLCVICWSSAFVNTV